MRWRLLLLVILLVAAPIAYFNIPPITLGLEASRYVLFVVLGVLVIAWAFQKVIDWRRNQLTQMRLTIEVAQAKQMIEGLFPPDGSFERKGILLAQRRRQATTVAGDFYYFIPRGDGSLGVYFVDVEGHGLAAANQARSVYQAVAAAGWGLGDARQQLLHADELVRDSSIFQKEEAAFAMNFTEIDPVKMRVRHANAGMPFPLLFRWGQAQPELLQSAGVYVGAGYGRYPVKPESVDVKVGDGDLLVVISDGILEARDRQGRTFGREGITAAVLRASHQSPEEIADEIIRGVQRHSARQTPEDDQTMVVVLIGEPVTETSLFGAKTLEEKDGVISLLNAQDTAAVCHHQLRERLTTWALKSGFEEKRAQQLWTACWEAIQNAVKYGSRPGDAIDIRLIPAQEDGFLGVELRKPVPWEDWDRNLGDRVRQQVEAGQPVMGGTVTMLWLADEIKVTDLGRRITMRFSSHIKPDRKLDLPSLA